MHHKPAQMRLREVCSVETVKTVGAEDTRLVVGILCLIAVDKEALLVLVHEFVFNRTHQLLD